MLKTFVLCIAFLVSFTPCRACDDEPKDNIPAAAVIEKQTELTTPAPGEIKSGCKQVLWRVFRPVIMYMKPDYHLKPDQRAWLWAKIQKQGCHSSCYSCQQYGNCSQYNGYDCMNRLYGYISAKIPPEDHQMALIASYHSSLYHKEWEKEWSGFTSAQRQPEFLELLSWYTQNMPSDWIGDRMEYRGLDSSTLSRLLKVERTERIKVLDASKKYRDYKKNYFDDTYDSIVRSFCDQTDWEDVRQICDGIYDAADKWKTPTTHRMSYLKLFKSFSAIDKDKRDEVADLLRKTLETISISYIDIDDFIKYFDQVARLGYITRQYYRDEIINSLDIIASAQKNIEACLYFEVFAFIMGRDRSQREHTALLAFSIRARYGQDFDRADVIMTKDPRTGQPLCQCTNDVLVESCPLTLYFETCRHIFAPERVSVGYIRACVPVFSMNQVERSLMQSLVSKIFEARHLFFMNGHGSKDIWFKNEILKSLAPIPPSQLVLTSNLAFKLAKHFYLAASHPASSTTEHVSVKDEVPDDYLLGYFPESPEMSSLRFMFNLLTRLQNPKEVVDSVGTLIQERGELVRLPELMFALDRIKVTHEYRTIIQALSDTEIEDNELVEVIDQLTSLSPSDQRPILERILAAFNAENKYTTTCSFSMYFSKEISAITVNQRK